MAKPTTTYRTLALTALAILILTGCGSNTKTNTTATNPPTTPTTNTTASTPTTSSQPNTAITPPAPTGSTSTSPSAAHEEEHLPTEEKIHLTSPAITNETLPAKYTCDGQNTPPPLHWTGVPPGTQELELNILKLNPVNKKLYFAWTITHIPPTSTGITNGKLPPGTITGTNSEGKTTYSLCPPRGGQETYVGVLFSVPRRLPAAAGFDAATLRKQVIHAANYEAFLTFKYRRH